MNSHNSLASNPEAGKHHNLNEESAFSSYIQALDRIRAEYTFIKNRQAELNEYENQYEKAELLLNSLGYEMPDADVDALDEDNISPLSLSDAKEIFRSGKSLADEAKRVQVSSESKIKSFQESIGKLNKESKNNGIAVSSLKGKIPKLESQQGLSNTTLIFGGISVLMFIGCCLNAATFGALFLGTIVVAFITNSLHESGESSPDIKGLTLSGVLADIEKLENEHKLLELKISEAKKGLDQQFHLGKSEAKKVREEVYEKLKNFSTYLLFAQVYAQDVLPRKFQALSHDERNNLGQAFRYWEHGTDTNVAKPPRMLSRPWQDDDWAAKYQANTEGDIPGCVRIGDFLLEHVSSETNKVVAPILIPAMAPIRAIHAIPSGRVPGHIVVFSDTRTRAVVTRAVEALAVRLLSTFPVRQLRGSFVDPIALGNTFPFRDLPKSILSGQQIFTRNQDIREELKNLVTHVEQVIQNYLGRSYETLEDYNAASESISEAYRYLFIADFPTGFDNQTLDDLKSLITNGGRAGVYTIIHVDTSKEIPRAFDYSLFDQHCTVIRPSEKTYQGDLLFELNMPNGWKRELILDRPPSQDLHQKITQALIAADKTVKVETIPFRNLYPTTLWQALSHEEIRAPIGSAGARERIEFWLGENDEKLTVSSGLLAGKPGAGKSYTLHSIILSLAMNYSPDELELYLLDYKEGVEFQIYVDPNRSDTTNPAADLDETCALPHAKVISIESDREFGLSVLQAIQQEIETRGQMFKNVGVSELKDYRQKTGEKVPRLLVVIDEFQYMFQDNDAITHELNQLYEDITRRGRSFGVHLLLASQSLNIANINSRIYGFIPLRMAMQMDQTTAAIVLAEGNSDSIELLDRSGKIIYNTEFGRKRQNQLGQIADISLEQRRDAMNQIYQQVETTRYERKHPLVIFQGNRPSKISQNGQLSSLTKVENWLSSSTLNKQVVKNPDWIAQEAPGVVWLGEAMRIGRHTQAILRRRARSNLLLIGQAEPSIFGMIGGALLSLVHVYQPSKAEFHLIDLSQTDDDEALSQMTSNFQQSFQDLYLVKLGKRFPESERGIKRAETILADLYDELQRRKQIRESDPDAMEFGPSIFFIAAIGSLNRAQNLRPVAGRRGDEMSPDTQKLQDVVAMGPEVGIHTILWFDNSKTFQQICGDSNHRNFLMQFDGRAVLQLPAEDSRLFLGETSAQSLPSLRGYFYDASLSEGFEKFKPYALLSHLEILEYSQRLKQRQQS